MAITKYKHAVKAGGKIIPAGTPIKTAETTESEPAKKTAKRKKTESAENPASES